MVYPKASTDPDAQGVPPTPRFPVIEERVLDYWRTDGTFQASVAARDGGEQGSNEFVFYDGPPFATGLPHYGHLVASTLKDIVPRYWTMRGRASSGASAGTPTACPSRWRPRSSSA